MQYIHEKMLSFKLKTKGLANRKMRLQKRNLILMSESILNRWC